MAHALGIALAGALGALARYYLGMAVASRTALFPLGTFIINILGSFLLGFLATATLERLGVDASLRVAITAGFLGAFTTFSTWSLETLRLLQSGTAGLALVNALGSLFLGILAAWLGTVAGRWI